MQETDPAVFVMLGYFLITALLSVGFFVLLFKHLGLRRRFRPVVDTEAEVRRLKQEGVDKLTEILEQAKASRAEHAKLVEENSALSQRRDQLQEELVPLEELHSDIEDGFQPPHFELDDHAQYVIAIKQIKEQQKQLARSKTAVVCPTEWTVGDSRSEGRKMTNRNIRMALRSFNNECDVIISKVTWRNIGQVKSRIQKSRDALDNLNESNRVFITDEFLELKLREADLVNQERLKKEEEKQRLREEREREREEAKAQREIIAEMRRQEALEQEKVRMLEAARERLKAASPEHRSALEAEVEEIEQQLSEAALAKGRLTAMAEHTRIGHVYVISNRGSFGERMVKIGMTRRLEPMDRVKELGDASVPFPFDLHAMVFSEDAPALEKELHGAFEEKRVNRVNNRKEFFAVSPEDVGVILQTKLPDTPFDPAAESLEFAASSANGMKSDSPTVSVVA